MKKTTMKQAIRMKCYDCAYDHNAGGRSAITNCNQLDCSLWGHRPGFKLDPEYHYEYVGFNIEDEKDIRGKWIKTELNKNEKKALKDRGEIFKSRVRNSKKVQGKK